MAGYMTPTWAAEDPDYGRLMAPSIVSWAHDTYRHLFKWVATLVESKLGKEPVTSTHSGALQGIFPDLCWRTEYRPVGWGRDSDTSSAPNSYDYVTSTSSSAAARSYDLEQKMEMLKKMMDDKAASMARERIEKEYLDALYKS